MGGPRGRDLDLLVDFTPGTDLFDIVRTKDELEVVFGAPVDLIPRDGLKERVRSAAAANLGPLLSARAPDAHGSMRPRCRASRPPSERLADSLCEPCDRTVRSSMSPSHNC